MGIKEIFSPALGMFGGTLSRLAPYWWVLFIFVGIAIAISIVVLIYMSKKKKAQWTHTLLVRRVLQNNLLSKPFTHKMRRFPLIVRAEVFELEKPLLGGYLIAELEQYSDVNEYSIVIDRNNRIYTNKGEFFVPDKQSVNVSAKHAEIDISRANLRAEYQHIHATSKRIEWAQIAKWAMLSLLVIAVMIVSIIAIGQWGDSYEAKAEIEKAQAETMRNLADAMTTSQATVNAQNILADKLIELTGTKNLQGVVQSSINGTA